MAQTVEQLKSLSYRELQLECKAQGIPAKGKADVLLGNLISKLQAGGGGSQPAAATPVAKKAAGPRVARPKVTVAPLAATPSPRKSIDKRTIQRALSTPLPVSPARPRTQAKRRGPGGSKTPYILGAFTAALLASVAAVAVPHCRQTDCVAQAQDIYGSAGSWTQQHASAATSWSMNKADAARAAASYQTAVVSEKSRHMVQAAWESYEALLAKIWSGGESSGAAPPAGFIGKLNTAVLDAVLRSDQGAAWKALRLSMEDVWMGRKIAENKANAVLFVCGSREACESAVEELAVAAPKESTLVLTASDAADGKGPLQTKLASFLRAHPRGVVVVSNVDKFSVDAIPVLSNGMGEGGAYQQDGDQVSATDATFFLTYEVPPAIMAEETPADFGLAAKTALYFALHSDADSEDSKAIASAFRRRIDAVAPTTN